MVEISIYRVAQSELSQTHEIGNIVNIDSEKNVPQGNLQGISLQSSQTSFLWHVVECQVVVHLVKARN